MLKWLALGFGVLASLGGLLATFDALLLGSRRLRNRPTPDGDLQKACVAMATCAVLALFAFRMGFSS